MHIQRLPTSLQHESETMLSRRIKAGDDKAFEEIFFRYYKHLYAIGLKFLKNPDLAEDAVQDIFLKLWDHRDALNEAYSIKNFLSIAMKNHVMNVIRDHHTAIWEYISFGTEELAGEDTTSNTYQLQEYGAILEQGLRQLPPQREKIFRLRVFSGLNNEQIAQQLSISVNTVKFQFSQATKFIKAYLGKHADLESALFAFVCLLLF
ncbi:RNA polymerase sigma-70 factor [Spirosoma validum]|uniref:RNA polymerase sigma-70 factor n=1 Tax=Spirosoma validum TaxID=2771355 RepID=A0A927AYY8_9BACT|nr:RNA polymerase sigma-70 factor [Spirosoma validum]MBD2752354.1 RNA polymerase sigma-70 factor [Spirosoma validum]